ncbi:unnamed protein product [Lymnaea stagnalis]|uniref:Serpin domain-containing protein n=1 Tax=Lymnaea stagnalis TaxID=6523 RepID=A0AAV2IK15_LYMST
MFTLVAVCAAVLGGLNLCLASSNPSPDVVTLIRSASRFSHKMYKELSSDLKVAVYSPFSAHAALSMAYLGARGTTADQMKSVLQLSSLPLPHEAYKSLLESLNYVQGVVVYTANGIWVNDQIKLRDDYKSSVVNFYNATAEQINFSAPGGPHVPINQWVADRTDDTIKDLLKADDIKPSTAAVLVNALYFNGTWKLPFNPDNTFKGQFQSRERMVIEADFMNRVGRFGVKLSAAGNVDVVKLPFTNENFSFYIVLPRDITDFPSLESRISGDDFDDSVFFTDVRPKYVNLTLPKFSITATLNLKNPLSNLGMPIAFSKDADFSGIADAGLLITDVVQKAVIEVVETGTVATAASFVDVGIKSGYGFEDPYKIVADRPFIFYIRDDDNGLILFQGKQTDPTTNTVEN